MLVFVLVAVVLLNLLFNLGVVWPGWGRGQGDTGEAASPSAQWQLGTRSASATDGDRVKGADKGASSGEERREVPRPPPAFVARRDLRPADLHRAQKCSAHMSAYLSEEDLWSASLAQCEAFSAIVDLKQCPLLSNRCLSFSNWLDGENAMRRRSVRDAIEFTWHQYEEHAFGRDELKPISGLGDDAWGGFGVLIVDALDTILLADLPDVAARALDWLKTKLTYDKEVNVNLFETTIRQLGGLLSTYYLLQTPGSLQTRQECLDRLLDEAKSLGGRLLKAVPEGTRAADGEEKREWGEGPLWLDSPPASDIKLHSGHRQHLAGYTSLSEIGTITLEFKTLSEASGDCQFAEAADAVVELIERKRQLSVTGLAPIFLDPKTLATQRGIISLGARGDSVYEYLAKEWILTGRRDKLLESMVTGFLRKLADTISHTAQPPQLPQGSMSATWGEAEGGIAYHDRGLVYVAELQGSKIAKMDHLVCFLPGLLMLIARSGFVQPSSKSPPKCDMASFPPASGPCSSIDEGGAAYLERLADELTKTCVTMYFRTKSGLAPEIVRFSHDDMTDDSGSMHSLLRPETLESLFYMAELAPHPDYFTHPPPRPPTGTESDGLFTLESIEGARRRRDVEDREYVDRYGLRWRNWGWRIFLATVANAKVAHGFASVDNVQTMPVHPRDKMHTFCLAETFKYLLLLFSPRRTLPLDRFVLNTEAHPLPIMDNPTPGGKCGRIARMMRHTTGTTGTDAVVSLKAPPMLAQLLDKHAGKIRGASGSRHGDTERTSTGQAALRGGRRVGDVGP
ncbi:unnamed protein product [Vitrella brassicaformis CCMP3155]|uniref:alpha-1,2-Mannosidase n=3 Tax=Vitrella brassicaformis TaxID=1169539 RepID=A0A0G4H894_VITBC|nr:unnamed protein product [Vitrella brassicaformis CCMP3155]|eukprot:CEM40138.1 unnamed protein product [Vitrella brassicaformis CCMP3155]